MKNTTTTTNAKTMTASEKIAAIRYKLATKPRARSAWDRGIDVTALDMIDRVEEWPEYSFRNMYNLEMVLLRGAGVHQYEKYVRGACLYVSNYEICNVYCTPSELSRKCWEKEGPWPGLDWMGLEARAVMIATWYIIEAAFETGVLPRP